MQQTYKCPLCSTKSVLLHNFQNKAYFYCNNCGSLFLNPDDYIDEKSEKERYLTHNNDVEDAGYRKFVSPIVNSVLSDFDKDSLGLDYGAGTGPVISKMLDEKDYTILQYDPFFIPDKDFLKNKYDYIVSCEVVEHFHNPKQEFERLIGLLKEGGKLYIKTDLYSKILNFEQWYYKDDPTHVFFYSERTFEWIKKHYAFEKINIFNRLIILSK